MAAKSALSQACRITIFTRENCSLCTTAKTVLDKIRDRRPFQLDQIDVMNSKNQNWKIYEFDVPVIHVEKLLPNHSPQPPTLASARKLMHRLKEEDVERLMDEAGKD